MKTIEILGKILICSFEIYMLYDLGKSILNIKMKRDLRMLVAVCSVMSFVVVNSFHSTLVNLICVPIIYLIYSMLVFNGTALKKLCVAVCYYILTSTPEFIFAVLIDVDELRAVSCKSHSVMDEVNVLGLFLDFSR